MHIALVGDTLSVQYKKKRAKQGFLNTVLSWFSDAYTDEDASDARVDFELRMPNTVDVAANCGKSNIHVRDMLGDQIAIHVGMGNIELHDIKSNIKIQSGYTPRLHIEYSKKDVDMHDALHCAINAGKLDQGVVAIPAKYCVKSVLTGSPIVTTIENQFEQCTTTPNIKISGSIGTGKLKIVKK